jgi:hypothetical protein
MTARGVLVVTTRPANVPPHVLCRPPARVALQAHPHRHTQPGLDPFPDAVTLEVNTRTHRVRFVQAARKEKYPCEALIDLSPRLR